MANLRTLFARGKYIANNFFGKYPELLKLVEKYSDEQLEKMKRGGHDPEKVYAASKSVEHKGAPTVILAKLLKDGLVKRVKEKYHHSQKN